MNAQEKEARVRASKARYVARNRLRLNAKQRARYRADPHKRDAYIREWQRQHPFRMVGYLLKFLAKNPDRPLFVGMASLDEVPEHAAMETMTPFDFAVMKEESLAD